MAFSRLAAGAHFLSDILFGFMIAFGITEAAKKLYAHHDETLAKLADVWAFLQEKVGFLQTEANKA